MDFLLWFAIFTTLETVNWLALSVLNSIKYNQVSWEEKSVRTPGYIENLWENDT